MADEKALAVIVPSREMRDNGATGGTFADDSGADLGSFAYQREHANSVPVAVMADRKLRSRLPAGAKLTCRSQSR